MPPKKRPTGRTAKKGKEKETTKPSQPGPFIYPKEHFDEALANLLYDAFKFRGSEYHLYPIYNFIIVLNCATLRHTTTSRISIAPCPQALFGVPPPAIPFGYKTAPKTDNKGEPPSQFPDFARIFVCSDIKSFPDGTVPPRDIVDFWELKALNSGFPWWHRNSSVISKGPVMADNLKQCQDQAEAGFAHNPRWTRIYALLIVGAFFTQLVWKDRPPEETLTPLEEVDVPDVSNQARRETARRPYGKIIDKLLAQIKRYEKRQAPEVVIFNAPVFDYAEKNPKDEYQPVSLSSEFLWALAQPLQLHFPDVPVEPTSWWFPKTNERPKMTAGDESLAKRYVSEAVRGKKIELLKQQARSLGHVFPGDKRPAVTPSPPVSQQDKSGRFRARGSGSRPDAPPLVTRASARAQAAAEAALADDAEDEGEWLPGVL
ncbi:hypothetical protein GSI_05938 [Ganoderma sinense ZZ0214-1]|uniref:Uncharacterized protein n=1 Tax=Ganoderma sinense ZZ0214-1 TaxID=1077348 RepID=A0A2G8SBV7_9APHY|nr:hypothetical protein GSI_05938 [Ganoderma sinense ZZ0214-1]